MQAAIDAMQSEVPKGATVALTGQATSMTPAYGQLLEGLGLVDRARCSWPSWRTLRSRGSDPMIVISALPAALAGGTWSLFLTGTTLSVPALTGATGEHGDGDGDHRAGGGPRSRPAGQHGDLLPGERSRRVTPCIRPVLMTALAMIMGMSPDLIVQQHQQWRRWPACRDQAACWPAGRDRDHPGVRPVRVRHHPRRPVEAAVAATGEVSASGTGERRDRSWAVAVAG